MSIVLSIIVPVYNMGKYLSQCLSSVILSSYRGKYEVLVINDGSTDDSLKIAKEFEQDYPDIFVVINKKNGGYGSCFNIGLEKASGKYIKMLDSDDFFDCSVFSCYLNLLQHRDEDIIINDCIKFDDKKNIPIGLYINNQEAEGPLKSLDTELLNTLFTHNFTFKNKTLQGCHCPEKIFYTDNIIYLYGISGAKSFYNSKLPIYYYRINRNGQSTDKNIIKQRYFDFFVMLKYVYKIKLPDVGTDEAKRSKMLQCMCELSYLPIKSLCSNSISYKLYIIYKEVIFNLREWSSLYKIKSNEISVTSVIVSKVLPISISYLLNFLVLHTIKRNA